MVAAGAFMIAFGNHCYMLFPGNYLSLILTLVLLGAPYLRLQTYMHHLRYLGRTAWLGYLDFAHAMGGPWQLSWSTAPRMPLLVAWLLTAELPCRPDPIAIATHGTLARAASSAL
jgi:hypothetical protein